MPSEQYLSKCTCASQILPPLTESCSCLSVAESEIQHQHFPRQRRLLCEWRLREPVVRRSGQRRGEKHCPWEEHASVDLCFKWVVCLHFGKNTHFLSCRALDQKPCHVRLINMRLKPADSKLSLAVSLETEWNSRACPKVKSAHHHL